MMPSPQFELVVVDSLQRFDEVDVDSEPYRHRKDLQELADGMTLHGRIVMLVAYQRTDEAFVIAQAIETFTFYRATAALPAVVAHDAIENRLWCHRLIKNRRGNGLTLKNAF